MSNHVYFKEGSLFVLDQRKIPFSESWVELKKLDDYVRAIKKMIVRGAPLIGIVAAYGFASGIKEMKNSGRPLTRTQIEKVYKRIASSRPTAQNLFSVLEIMKSESLKNSDSEGIVDILFDLAERIHRKDTEDNIRLSEYGEVLIEDGDTILTHCNAGELATGGYGTALGVLREAYRKGKRIKVFATETRPFLQGARLTAFELSKLGIEFEIIPDNHAGFLISKGKVNKVIVGADRVARNGDTANKIGTYMIALCAERSRVPFYVACPTSTFDLKVENGDMIPIEEREGKEVLKIGRSFITSKYFRARYFSFDITPSQLITAFITERGIVEPPFLEKIPELLIK